MRLKLSFLGAAQNVTGSCFLLEADGRRILVDCGMYQERQFRDRNWNPFPFEPAELDAVLLTHAHVDHCGLLPKLVREGFRGPVHCTPATAELVEIILLDAGKLQQEDAEFKRRRHEREGRRGPHPVVPLYTVEDAQRCVPLLAPVPYDVPQDLGGGVEAVFHEAGHILGSSAISIHAGVNGQRRTVLFSGDVGRSDRPILRDPDLLDHADYVVLESTYGDRIHPPETDKEALLAEIINRTHEAGGNVVIPSFSVERAQELLYHLNRLLAADAIPHLMTFVDSPMAIKVTEVFENHPELYDREMQAMVRQNGSPFQFRGLKMCRTVDESKAINHIRGTVLVIAGSGMCTGGRIKHHLVQNIRRPESTILFVGYQAVGTLGRLILDGRPEVRILGQMLPVRARIERIHGFSGHADRDELVEWVSGLRKDPQQVFVVHGEADTAEAFAEHLRQTKRWRVSVPGYQDQAVLE